MALSLTSYAVPVGSDADCAGRAWSEGDGNLRQATSETLPDLFHAARVVD